MAAAFQFGQCISSITVPELSSVSTLTLPNDLNGFALTLQVPPSYQCSYLSSAYFPLTVQLKDSNQNVAGQCGRLTQDQLAQAGATYTIDCQVATSTIVSGAQYTLVESDPQSFDGFIAAGSIVTASAGSLCTASLSLTPPPNNLYYSTSDAAHLDIGLSYLATACTDWGANSDVFISITDPNVGYAAYGLYTFPSSIDGKTASQILTSVTESDTLSTSDFRYAFQNGRAFPPIGQLPDGTYTITLTSSYLAQPLTSTFVVGHQLAPSAGARRRRRGRDLQWQKLAQGDVDQANEGLDSSFFFKARTSDCAHTLCPVFGQVGVFECIDTQSNLEMCGGCTAPLGQVCTDIPGAASIECIGGRCVVHECNANLTLSFGADGSPECS